MENLISIIVPVYKTEQFLDECVNSIVSQTYSNIEIILVDDGSPDNCPKMCDEWVKRDSRIKVIHKKNGGVSSARNEGIKISKGEYVCFVDSDDYLLPNYCEFLLKNVREYKSALVICNFLNDGEKDFRLDRKLLFDIKSSPNSFVEVFAKYEMLMPWNKIYRKELIKETFEEGVIYGEDEIFNLNYCINIDKIVVIPESLYYYRANPNSVTHSKSIELFKLRAGSTNSKREILLKVLNDDHLANHCCCFRLFSHLEKIILELLNEKKSKKEIVEILENILSQDEVSSAFRYHENKFSMYKDIMYHFIKKQKYYKLINLVKFKDFIKKLLHKD